MERAEMEKVFNEAMNTKADELVDAVALLNYSLDRLAEMGITDKCKAGGIASTVLVQYGKDKARKEGTAEA